LIRLLPPLLALGYLALAHAAAISASPGLALAAGALLLLLVTFAGLLARRPWAFAVLAAGALLLAWLHERALGVLPLYAPPVLLNLFFAWLFGHTLRRGPPLIERLARAMSVHVEPIDPALLAYARRLTLAWTLLFLLLAAVNLGLALLARPDGLLLAAGIEPPLTVSQGLWSLFANLLNYVIVGLFFVLEFAWRKHRFADLPYRSFAEFCRRMARLGPDALRLLARG
jgi:uncharacterized membrane protein